MGSKRTANSVLVDADATSQHARPSESDPSRDAPLAQGAPLDQDVPFTDLGGTILADGVVLGTDMHQTHLNNNVIVFGTPGGGKTESIVKPNIMQMNSSYVVTDPKGNLHRQLRPLLEEAGYQVCTLDFTSPESSMTFNPFRYVRSEQDLDFLARAIIRAEGRQSKDPFWDDAAELLLKSIMAYCTERARRERLSTVTFADVAKVADYYSYAPQGSWPGVHNALEECMEEVHRGLYWNSKGECIAGFKDKGSLARKTWLRFLAVTKAETTTSCIVMSMWGTLNRLTGAAKEHLFSNDDPVPIEMLGRRKIALFVVVSDTDRSMDFMVSVFYAQLFKELCRVADNECLSNGNRLFVPVRVILDDFANQAPIDNFETYIAAMRSRDIWLMPICQATSQLELRYGSAASTIIGCCDSVVYLGVNDMRTAAELAERADMPIADVQKLPIGTALVFVRGHEPQKAPRYDISQHPNHPFLKRARMRAAGKCASRARGGREPEDEGFAPAEPDKPSRKRAPEQHG